MNTDIIGCEVTNNIESLVKIFKFVSNESVN